MKQLSFLLFITILWQAPSVFSAQTQDHLSLENIKAEKERTVAHNKKVKVTRLDGSRLKGRLVGVDSTTLYLSTGSIPLKEIDFLRIKFLGTQLVGFTLSTIGTASLGLGALVIVSGALSGDDLTLLFSLLIGGVLVVAGVLIDAVGIPLSQLGKKYKLQGENAWILLYD